VTESGRPRPPSAVCSGAAGAEAPPQSASRAIRAHYQQLFAQHGAGHQAVQWSSRETQHERFSVLAALVGEQDRVIDVGCGLGELLGWLRRERGFRGDYLGLDLVPEFVRHASQAHAGDTQATFREFDITMDALPVEHDVVLLSGMFNNQMPDNWGFLTRSVEKMYAAARARVGFNALSTYVDYQASNLYYADPLRVFDYCRRQLGARVDLRHAYQVKPGTIPFEFTIHLFK
jgi:SAM-dependent methyltransferase